MTYLDRELHRFEDCSSQTGSGRFTDRQTEREGGRDRERERGEVLKGWGRDE